MKASVSNVGTSNFEYRVHLQMNVSIRFSMVVYRHITSS